MVFDLRLIRDSFGDSIKVTWCVGCLVIQLPCRSRIKGAHQKKGENGYERNVKMDVEAGGSVHPGYPGEGKFKPQRIDVCR